MPAAYDYYSKHSRKLSSSQMSLPDQLQNSVHPTASKSTTFLPATTYVKSSPPPPDAGDAILSPDSFYRQYHNQYSQQQGAPLRQGAIKTTDLDIPVKAHNGRSASFTSVSSLEERRAAYENGQLLAQDPGRSLTVSPGLRGRKASVRNLVAQINATSNDEVPRLPTQSVSRNASRNVSPVLLSNAHFQPTTISRTHSDHAYSYSGTYHEMNGRSHTTGGENGLSIGSPEMASHNRRPLFGEVVPGLSVTTNAGYGIQNIRKRSGSEGSPLIAPHFTPHHQNKEAPDSIPDSAVSESDPNFMLTAATYKAPNTQPVHRRANSESPLTPTYQVAGAVTSHTHYSTSSTNTKAQDTTSSSRTKSGTQNPSSDVSSNSRATANHSNPRPRQRSLPQIQSPGQRGKKVVTHQGAKSPSLRANIIVPPPKISPPLRSSRPRQPVSSASTAASRARMAEKFSNMQKINDEKRRASRRAARPPELTDIDLKARRLRITQALSRSLEGQDLKGNTTLAKHRDFSRSGTASPTFSDQSRHTEPVQSRSRGIPAVVIDTAAGPDHMQSDQDTPQDGTPRESIVFAQNALDAMQGSSFQDEDKDSSEARPVAAGRDGRLTALETNIRRTDRNQEPWSALTDATENTTIDPEPQDDVQRSEVTRSVLSQIQDMRGAKSMRQASYDTFSDHGDQESVQLVLRDTLYLDDDEAIQKGYRPAPQLASPLMESPEIEHNLRSSWISSVEDSDEQGEPSPEQTSHNTPDRVSQENGQKHSSSDHTRAHDDDDDMGESVRSTMASDAYTIVNVVLQQHSLSGLIDQQFVDDVYQRILEDSPYDIERLSQERIEQMCLREIQDREESWFRTSDGEPQSPQSIKTEQDVRTPTRKTDNRDENHQDQSNWLSQTTSSSSLAPPPIKGHRYKSSLGSAEDWLDASPSISDWMRFQAEDQARHSVDQKAKAESITQDPPALADSRSSQDDAESRRTADGDEDSELYAAPPPRAPSHSPPLPPDQMPSIEQTSFGTAIIERPSVPRRITSLSQMSRSSTRGRSTPNASAPTLGKASMDEPLSPEQRRLKQRRNVIKELVDTEFTYEKDLRVLCDIYKQTASVALGEEDIKVLFGNVEQVQEFSKDFLMLLKSHARPTYRMERPDRKKERNVSRSSSLRPSSSSSTLASVRNADPDLLTNERDQETQIGQAFEASLHDMEKVYSEYIKNRHAANLRLEAVQKSPSAREWLKECKDNSSDITNAWNLDALLVKPVQRITKYPLLLKELVDSTPEGHPDLSFLRRAMHEVTEVNMRINDVKKHAELVDQVLNRKRKDSDVRAGLSKAFGRRAEKLKQQVGMTEMYEDGEYNEIKINYDNNIVQLMVVGNDCSSYGRAVTKWVNKMLEIAAAAEAWVDVGHSNHQEAESRLRQFAMVVRGISTIALPDHLEQLSGRILSPMQQAVDAMTKFKTDPKGLLQKREKRMIDYAQIKTKKDRGEKIDKKTTERMEQSEALNVEAKERMRKLIKSTAQLVQNCQASLVHMQMTWQGMVKQKLSAAMGISLEHLDVDDIEKEWQMDFDFQEASALSLGVCNGSLLAEAVNMVTYPASGSTLVNGQDSPRQGSFTSASKRSISMTSTNENYPPIPEYDPRTSGTTGFHFREPSLPFANNRTRTQSSTSSKYVRTPDLSNPPNQHGSTSEGFGTSHFGRSEENMAAPRLSIETPSPLIGLLQPDTSRRPGSSSTFFSATGSPPMHQQPHQQHQSTGSSIFSSAMPMSDSPVTERHPEPNHAKDPDVLFTAASVYEFNIDRSRREAGFPYLTYVTGEIFDIIGERGELWLAKNQDDPQKQIGWIWNKHFAKLAE